jgi:D-alanyl-D-alanine dipeptidase
MVNTMHHTVQDFAEKPIPIDLTGYTTVDYHDVPIDFNSPEYKEPLVNLASLGISGCSHYARQDKQNPPYFRSFGSAPVDIYLRKGAAEQLLKANELLKPYGAEVHVYDGFRPISMQIELFDYFKALKKQRDPKASEQDCIEFAQLYCVNPTLFDPEDFRTWTLHGTGGAVDLALKSTIDGQIFFFGSIFDDGSSLSHTTYFEQSKEDNISVEEARRNRRILYWAMINSGFTNYWPEWWHYDYLNQMWALISGKEVKAKYGMGQI